MIRPFPTRRVGLPHRPESEGCAPRWICAPTRVAVAALAISGSTFAGAMLVPSSAFAAPAVKVWSAGSSIYAQIDRMPPGAKSCLLQVPPTFYDVIGLTLGSGVGKSDRRETGGSSLTLSVGGLLPGPYDVHLNCLHPGHPVLISTTRRVSVGGLS